MRQKFWWALQSLTRRSFSSASYPPIRGRLQIRGRTQHERTWRRFLRFFAIVAMTTADKFSLSWSSASMFDWRHFARHQDVWRVWRMICVGGLDYHVMYYEYLCSCVRHVEGKCRTATGNMSKQQATCSVRHAECRMLQVACCFDMLLVWTGHQSQRAIMR